MDTIGHMQKGKSQPFAHDRTDRYGASTSNPCQWRQRPAKRHGTLLSRRPTTSQQQPNGTMVTSSSLHVDSSPLAIANRYYDANSEPVQNTRYRLILTKTSTLNWVTRWACNAEPQRTRQSWNMSLGAKNSGATMGVKSIRPTWFEDETVAKTAAEPMHALRLIIKEDVLPLRNHPEALDRRCITASAAREIKGRNSRAVIGVKSTRPTLFEDETAAKQPLYPCMVYVSSSKRIFCGRRHCLSTGHHT